MAEPSYDYIIAGAGAAGLSLAYRLGSTDKRVLLIDRAPKTLNDRTWCFWEQGQGPFEPIVHRAWNHIWFHGEGISERFEISPYRYKMIRGIDFYRFMQDWLERQSNIELVYGEVLHISDGENRASIETNKGVFEGGYVFNSLYRPPVLKPGDHHLLQHFKGWVIEVAEPTFDPRAATFMDFRIEQHGEVRFVYVLPLDERRALVEYTLFSKDLLPETQYDDGLRDYLQRFLGLSEWKLLEVETGVIPMTDASFRQKASPHVMNIGMAGGRTKASTGFTFQRIQRQSTQIAHSLKQSGHPFYPKIPTHRFAWYDRVLLHILEENGAFGKFIFSDLFRRNPPQRVLKFLDEQTSLLEEARLTSSLDIPVFLRAAMAVHLPTLGLYKTRDHLRSGK